MADKERVMAIIRIVALFVTAFNAILTASGKNPIPFDESALGEAVSYIVTFIAALWAWWKNNNMTKEAQLAQQKLKELKENRNKAGGENNIDPENK